MNSAGSTTPPIRKVLIVEDVPDTAYTLRLVLESFGYEVRVAYTGLEGVAEAEQWLPDAVVCDIGLPELDGYGVARALRRQPKTAQTQLIALTGYGAAHDQARAFEAGFDAHYTKPLDPEVLRTALVRPCRRRRGAGGAPSGR